MRQLSQSTLQDVQAIYSGPEARLWEMLMGQQVHIGGMRSSLDLAERAGLRPGLTGVDLCCFSGAGMRFLVRFCEARRMVGVDATAAAVELGRGRCLEAGVADRIEFVHADAVATGLPSAMADFVWGEDAWCYVLDKPALIAEAVRLARPGGTIAFTDWVEGSVPMSAADGSRLGSFMKFANIESIDGYGSLLAERGCTVSVAGDTGRFAECVELYIRMIELQLTSDALALIGYDAAKAHGLLAEMSFMLELARTGRLCQGIFVARTPLLASG